MGVVAVGIVEVAVGAAEGDMFEVAVVVAVVHAQDQLQTCPSRHHFHHGRWIVEKLDIAMAVHQQQEIFQDSQYQECSHIAGAGADYPPQQLHLF